MASTGSSSSPSWPAAIAIASRAASLSLPYPGASTVSDTSMSPASNAAGHSIIAASAEATCATLAPWLAASRRTQMPSTGTRSPNARRPTSIPAWVSALPEAQTTASKPMPRSRACSVLSSAATT